MTFRRILLFLVIMVFMPSVVLTHSEEDYSSIIESFRKSIPKLMRDQRVPGLAAAVVTGSKILWLEGFGYTDWDKKIPVTQDTLFSIQSMSKNFTAAAVLKAVEEGLLDLDTPISEYIPEFTVKSRFEEKPQDKITLRLLLSHQAGFTHEAPVGNNFVPGGFEEHIRSISRTWLRFPVGQRYSYSNLGIDLAGWILQTQSGLPFHEYVKKKLLDPMGMEASTFNMKKIKADSRRAAGHDGSGSALPVEIPMIPSGGFYSNAAELAGWVQWHLNGGKIDSKPFIAAGLFQQMYDIPNRLPHQTSGYGLGTGIRLNHNSLRFGHGGGGFGFLSAMNWYPEWNLGAVLLANCSSHDFQHSLINSILDRFLEAQLGSLPARPISEADPSLEEVFFSPEQLRRFAGRYLYNRNGYMIIQFKDGRLAAGDVDNPNPFTFYSEEGDVYIDFGGSNFYCKFVPGPDGSPGRFISLHEGQHLDYNDGPEDPPGPDRAEWDLYVGEYRSFSYGQHAGTYKIHKKNGYLWIDYMKLKEYRKGIFFTAHGECLDFTGPQPAWRNIKLKKHLILPTAHGNFAPSPEGD